MLKLWIDRHAENSLQLKKWDEAVQHSRLKLLNKTFLAWIAYYNVKIEKANKIAHARCLYESQLLRMSLKKFASNVTKRIAKRATLERATNQYKKILLKRTLRVWVDHHRRAVSIERKIQIRREKVDNLAKEKILWHLRLYVWKKKCSRRRNNSSANHYKRKLAKKSIAVLKNYLLHRKAKAMRLLYLNSPVTRTSHQVQKVYIARWRTAVIRRAQERQKIRRVEDLSSARSMKRSFANWRSHTKSRKIEAERKKLLRQIGETVLLNKYVKLWTKKCEAAAKAHEKNNRAVSIFDNKLKTRSLNHWKRYVDDESRKRSELDEAKKFHRKQLLREGLKKILKICLRKSEARYDNRLQKLRANCLEDFETKKKFFNKWWRLSAEAKENRPPKISKTTNEGSRSFCEISRAKDSTHRLVIPEYMKDATNFEENCNFYQQRHFPPRKAASIFSCRISSSDSCKSTDSSFEAYDIADENFFT